MLDPRFIKPVYDGRCFAAIPASIETLLTGQGKPALAADLFHNLPRRYNAVVLFLADGFGWRFVEKLAADHPALRRFADAGAAHRLLAQFPSTTAAHVTCLHTGQPPAQSGIYEWQYYEPKLDAVITPLLFSYAGTKDRDQLRPTGIRPDQIYPTHTLYQRLAGAGIKSYVFQHREYTPSTYSDIMYAGAETVGYRTFPEGLVRLRELLAQRRGPAYYVFYFDRIDGICHEYGPGASFTHAEMDAFLTILERQFLGKLEGRGKTLVMLTADHGAVEVDPATTRYLNTDPALAPVVRWLRTDRAGRTLVPAGSARDAFLYVQDAALDEAHDLLGRALAGRAQVCRVADLIAAGYFGAPVSAEFLARVGNLVLLPFAGEAVWWYEKDKFEQKFYGHHGGLTPQEMEIPLLLGCF